MKYDLHSFPSSSRGFESRIIVLSGGLEMEDLYGESLIEETLSMNTSESLFLVEFGGGGNLAERSMPPPVMTKEEIEAACQRR